MIEGRVKYNEPDPVCLVRILNDKYCIRSISSNIPNNNYSNYIDSLSLSHFLYVIGIYMNC